MHCEPTVVDGIHRHFIFAVLASLGLMAGCTTTTPTPVVPAAADATQLPLDRTLVARHGRYTLVELTPESAQNDLMEQFVDITFPATVVHSVADALRYLLLRSEYQLSDGCDAAHAFDAWPLPTAHQHLGPLTLRTALQILVGPRWQLRRDDASRTVCFSRDDSTQPAIGAQPTGGVDRVPPYHGAPR